MSRPTRDPIDFIFKEKWITITVIGSIFTFAMISKFREFIFDPLIESFLPAQSFHFMNLPLTKKENFIENVGSKPSVQSVFKINKISFGLFFRETIIWLVMIILLYLVAHFTRWPTEPGGNTTGAAIM